MARTTRKPVLVLQMLDPAKALALLIAQRASGQNVLEDRPISDGAWDGWEASTLGLVQRAFGPDSPQEKAIKSVHFGSFRTNAGEEWWEEHRAKSLAEQLKVLDGINSALSQELELDKAHGQADSSEAIGGKAVGRRVFVVHGHNDLALQETSRFIELVGLEVVILREQPNKGRTIIEKFSDYADVAFAVVLLTADDVGRKADANPDNLMARARQNVVLELGFFLGRLGRQRVCPLVDEGVEIPSDYEGVVYVRRDPLGAWKMSLLQELVAAGLPAKTDRLFTK